MAIEVVLPKVDMDMENGVIAQWLVAEGAHVRKGDILFEMETNKALMEVESPASGRIRGLAPVTGEPVDVGTPVAWIDGEDERPQPADASPSVPDTAGRVSIASSEAAQPVAAPAAAVAASDPVAEEGTGVRASPLARSIARTHGVALESIQGSGPRGRIVASDVEARSASAARSQSGENDASRVVPFNAVRRTAAHRLAESARTAPHFYLTAQVEMTALLAAREHHAPAVLAATGAKPGVTAMLAYLAARVLRDHPMLNASVEGDAARVHAHAHIGVAMDHEGDLYVPVIRNASTRSFVEVAAEFARLREAVRSRSITPNEMRGGTFTVSNLGMYGVDAFTAIINPPQSAILAVGRVVDTPVGRDGLVVLRPIATLTLSCDHRIIDGARAARFMGDLVRAIESSDGFPRGLT